MLEPMPRISRWKSRPNVPPIVNRNGEVQRHADRERTKLWKSPAISGK